MDFVILDNSCYVNNVEESLLKAARARTKHRETKRPNELKIQQKITNIILLASITGSELGLCLQKEKL